MINQYKVTISNNNIYKEIDLPQNTASYTVGTSIDCDYRLRKEMFFDDIKLVFLFDGANWSVMCSDNVYISSGDAIKLINAHLNHGDSFFVKYQDSDNIVFNLEFGVDFDSKSRKFERKIDLSNVNSFSIGTSSSANIIIKSEYLYNDVIELYRNDVGFNIRVLSISFGIYINGNKVTDNIVINDGDFFAISDYTFYYKDNSIWTEANDTCRVNGLRYKDYKIKNNYPFFSRNTRINTVIDETEIEILDPPTRPQKPKNNLVMTLLPSMGMLVASGVMAFMGGAMIIFSLVSGVMAIITAIVGVIQSKKEYKKDISNRIEKYNNYLKKKRSEIEDARKKEVITLNNIYISKDNEYQRFEDFSSCLFDRKPEDEDFLCVRVGTGSVSAKKKINYKKQEKLEIEDNLQEMPEVICKEYKMVDGAPIICNLKDINAIGIIGNISFRYEMFKTFTVDIIARHFPTDVKMFYIVEESNKSILQDVMLLPYVDNEQLNCKNIVCDEESKKAVFEFLFNELSRRESLDKKENIKEHFVVFFYDLYEFTSHPVSRFVEKAKDLGVTFIFFGEEQKDIPMGCEKIIYMNDEISAELIDTKNSLSNIIFNYDKVNDSTLRRIFKLVAPIKAGEISLEGSLTKNINLFELLNIFGVEDIDLKQRWASTEVYKSMGVPLGVSKTGIVYLDLHDKAHGPHGLVAGTTGSGKSEILQTYILSIATFFHPYEVAFVIIDFKGGGMVNQFRNLPHLLGAITNIDGKEIDRSLKSIKAELQKRQRLFADADVNHIDLYIKKYKSGEVSVPLPHLIIIVDEFAELKAEQPDFMKELISAARIGRSLGVHLILATQKPAGQVDDQIWSNSRFKLCLKVQGPEDSNEVLKSPLAAEIKEPGRAYLQVGNNEIFELFQSAYSGASEKDVDNAVKPFKISEVDIAGRRSVIYEQKNKTNEEIGITQLNATVNWVEKYCKENNIEKLFNICLPALSKKIEYIENDTELYGFVDLGIYDDPENQYQGSTYIDISNKNTFIVGSAQYGKTNLLQLIIREIVEKNTVSQANIYIIDFGSKILKVFEKLNHVGGVVFSSDDEKLKNLFKMLLEQIEYRKEKIVSVGLSSFSAYYEAGYKDLPHIYLIIDNFTALLELYLENDDSLLNIIREGIGVGITVVAANMQTNGINYRYLTNFANKIALYCNDSNEYSNLFGHTTLRPDETPGRIILEVDKRKLECQTYLSFIGEKEYERAKEIQLFIDKNNELNEDVKAKQIPFIPNVLLYDDLCNSFELCEKEYNVAIGLSYENVSPFMLDLAHIGAIGLCGKEGRGHYTFISNVLNRIEKHLIPAKVYIFDDVSRKYRDFKSLGIVKKYSLDSSDIENILKGWKALLENRYNSMLNEVEAYDNDLLLLIIQNNDVATYIAKNLDLLNIYKDIVNKYKAFNVGIIFANYNNSNVPYDAPEPIRMIKSERHMLCFDDLDNLKVFDVNYEDIRANKKRLQLGDAYYINDNIVTKLKLIKV